MPYKVDFTRPEETIHEPSIIWVKIPSSDGFETLYVTHDYLRSRAGTYIRATEESAETLAMQLEARLPTPKEAERIFQHAIYKHRMKNFPDPSPEIYDLQVPLSDEALALIEKKDDGIMAGHLKSVVKRGQDLGLYGGRWLSDGTLIQSFFKGHRADYRDYSQGLRLVRDPT